MPIFPLASLQAFTGAYSQSDFFGKLIMGGLFILSLLCWIVLVYKIWQARKVKISSLHLQKLLKKNKNRLLNLEPSEVNLPLPKHIPQPFAQIYFELKEKTVETLNKKLFFLKQLNEEEDVYLTSDDINLLEQHVTTTISIQGKILEKHLFILSTIVTLAPFLGLLGTVWGILVTFAELHAGGSAGSNSIILGGLSTALATTVLGLIIAIPALISYNYLKNNLKSFSSDMEDFLYTLLSTLELQYRKADLT
ncbi:MAG: MotA/TolQ/ExbB proton channel family protein [Chlamydiota bacterium]